MDDSAQFCPACGTAINAAYAAPAAPAAQDPYAQWQVATLAQQVRDFEQGVDTVYTLAVLSFIILGPILAIAAIVKNSGLRPIEGITDPALLQTYQKARKKQSTAETCYGISLTLGVIGIVIGFFIFMVNR